MNLREKAALRRDEAQLNIYIRMAIARGEVTKNQLQLLAADPEQERLHKLLQRLESDCNQPEIDRICEGLSPARRFDLDSRRIRSQKPYGE